MSTVDVHCHILPGLDDGSPDVSTSLSMAQLAIAADIGTVIGTPHWIENEHETDPAVVRTRARDLQAALDEMDIHLTVMPGNEAFICPDLPDRVKSGDILTLADKGTHVLLELPYENAPIYIDDVIFRLELQGLVPVLAHVERYAYVRRDWHVLERWIQHGCLAQVNAASLDPERGDHRAQALVDRGLVACTATDAHDVSLRPPRGIWNDWGRELLDKARQ